jgi:hypothetical protein
VKILILKEKWRQNLQVIRGEERPSLKLRISLPGLKVRGNQEEEPVKTQEKSQNQKEAKDQKNNQLENRKGDQKEEREVDQEEDR